MTKQESDFTINHLFLQKILKSNNQTDKPRNGVVIVLRNEDLNQSINIRNLPYGSKVNNSPANALVDDEMILVAFQKPNSNVF